MDKIDYPPAGTWDVIDRHGEPRYVVEHDGKGGWWGVCQPDRPEDCYVLAASKDLLVALRNLTRHLEYIGMTREEDTLLEAANDAIARAEGK